MSTQKIPANAAAVEVQRLRGVNTDILEQIRVLHETRDRNSETIGILEHSATWQDVIIVEEPAPVEPEPEPEPEPVEPEPEEEPNGEE